MIKQVVFLKKKSNLDTAAFRTYYERHHRLIGERVLGGYVTKYVRRYIDQAQPSVEELPFDVITEMWFADAERQSACMQHLRDPAIASEIAADEARLFEPGTKWGCVLREVESEM